MSSQPLSPHHDHQHRDSGFVEERILATMLKLGELHPDLEPEWFAYRDNAYLFKAMTACLDRFGVLSAETLGDYLHAIGGGDMREWLGEFAEGGLTSREVLGEYVGMLEEIRAANRLQQTLETIGGIKVEDPQNDKERAIASLEGLSFGRKAKGLLPVKAYMGAVIERIEARFSGAEIPGVPSGFPTLDKFTGGWHRSDLIVVAARPAVGKTALALNLALTAAQAGHRVNIVSAEQPAEQIIHRMMAILGQFPAWKLRSPSQMREDEWPRFTAGGSRLGGLPLNIYDDPSPSVTRIASAMRPAPADLVIVDYLQRLKAPGEKSPYERVSAIAQGLKEMARTFNVPVIALAQINRAGAENAKMEHLKGSGDIEQEADLIAILERRSDEAQCSLALDKNRHGATGIVELLFAKETMTFREMAREEDDYGR